MSFQGVWAVSNIILHCAEGRYTLQKPYDAFMADFILCSSPQHVSSASYSSGNTWTCRLIKGRDLWRSFDALQENRAELGKDIDMNKYVAGAIVVFDLHLRDVKWVQHLDLSTDHTLYRAYIYAAPTLADLDSDGKLEIIVGTSMVASKYPSRFLPVTYLLWQ